MRDIDMDMNFRKELEAYIEDYPVPDKYIEIMVTFFCSYAETVASSGMPRSEVKKIFIQYFNLLIEEQKRPTHFQPFHKRVTEPFDHFAFGLDFFRPLIIKENSLLLGKSNAEAIDAAVKRGENVILLANHQTEGDPQTLSLLLEEDFPLLSREMIFVAGDRVITDPLAIPFSKGCNLLCIYSKKYIDHPPEKKHEKQLHNKRTMQLMSELLNEGGQCIYVAPSGGRDRRNSQGIYEVAPFDPQSIEMFYLMTKKAKAKTHFHTLALLTYKLLPPPDTVQIDLGETRLPKRMGMYAYFGEAENMDTFPGCRPDNKIEQRHIRAEYLRQKVTRNYKKLIQQAVDYDE